MKVQVFQHVPFEDIASIGPWLQSRNAELCYTRFYQGEEPPEDLDYDMLLVMGGPMSVLEEDVYPWLVAEQAHVRRAMEAGKAVLGICLGAQLMAASLGASIRKNTVKEIGWLPLQAVEHGTAAFSFPAEINVFHWHGETFDMPTGAVRLAATDQCRNQAFQIGERALGLQFHLETTPESALSMVKHCADELVPGVPSIQSAQEILSVPPTQYATIQELLSRVLEYMLRPLPAR